MEPPKMIAVDANAMPWEERFVAAVGKSNYRKMLLQDPDTGMEVRLLRYPAGFTTIWHTHNCGHGIYVLEGTLATHEGNFGPGSFVWFPEGLLMEHGATAHTDALVLFITNKKFDINFVEKK